MHEDHFIFLFRFYESTDTDAFFKKANLLDPKKHKKIEGKSDFCKICCEKNRLIGLLCNHLFCSECWSNYLSSKVFIYFFKYMNFLDSWRRTSSHFLSRT